MSALCARCGGSRGREPRATTLLCPDCRLVMGPVEAAAFLGRIPPVPLEVIEHDDEEVAA